MLRQRNRGRKFRPTRSEEAAAALSKGVEQRIKKTAAKTQVDGDKPAGDWETSHAVALTQRSKWEIKAWDSHKLQIPGLSYNWWEFKARNTLQDRSDNSSIDKAETSLDWQEHFSQPQDTTDALPSHIPSSCMLVNHGPSQQSSKEEYKPCKYGATARYHTSHTKTMLPTRKPAPRSSRQFDQTKTSWRS